MSVAGSTGLLPSEAYRELIASGVVEPDLSQRLALERMDDLCRRLAAMDGKGGKLARLLQRKKPKAPVGLYLRRSVGRGKTKLMDLMLEAAPVEKKQRLHFQAFMADIHNRIHRCRESV